MNETVLPSAVRRSLAVFPAGSNGEFDLPAERSLVIARGEGCRLWDTEDHEYLDFSMGWGSVLVGHANPMVRDAVVRQAARGSNFAYVTDRSLELAEELVRLSPACQQIRFCASGTEATFYCLRLARAATCRPAVLKFEGAYHGAHDLGVASLFPTDPPPFPQPMPSSAGTDSADVLVAPFNDLETTRRLIGEHADRLAAVIVEPLHRCCPPEPGFLEGVRQATRCHGVLLIFDEVVTGLRLAYGGAQEYYGVEPDLVAYGKALGGGYPIGAFGGGAEIMRLLREDRLGSPNYVWSASTLGGNPISASAALAALEVLRGPGTYDRLHQLGEELRTGMRRVLAARNVVGQVIGAGPLAQVVFTSEPVRDYRSTRRADRARARRVMLGLVERGVFLNPMGTKLYLSIAHDERVVDAFLDRFDAAIG